MRGLLTLPGDPAADGAAPELAGRRLELDPQVALRPEPFGALAYHHGTRRLTFLRSAELVALVSTLGDHPRVDEALAAGDVAPALWPSFRRALAALLASGVIRDPEAQPSQR